MISAILKQDSRSVGSSTTRGVEVGGVQLALGDPNSPDSVRKALRNPAVDAAVLEIGFASLMQSGLGYEDSDVFVVTNISRGDLKGACGLTTKQLLLTCAVVCRSTSPDGCLILNADDEMCLRLGRRFLRSLFYFSAGPRNSNLHEKLRPGDRALVLGPDGILTLFRGTGKEPVFAIDFPRLQDEILCSRSSLGAAATCIALGSGPKSIQSGLTSSANGKLAETEGLTFRSVDNGYQAELSNQSKTAPVTIVGFPVLFSVTVAKVPC